MCLGILSLDRNYSDILPRRPEGGPDGGRDIQCRRLGEKCFGAVGFVNHANDSPTQKRTAKEKFKQDAISAKKADSDVKAFVFFSNVDFTLRELDQLKGYASKHGFSHVDVYYRERMRIALDSTEGLALRFQYLDIHLSDAEQASFFARYGKELEDIIRGRFDHIERKLDENDFARWRIGPIRTLELKLILKNALDTRRNAPEHFRFAMDFQGVSGDKRGIILGGRDEYLKKEGDKPYWLMTKEFFWQESTGRIEDSWLKARSRTSGGYLTEIAASVLWAPYAPLIATQFDGLVGRLHVTENLVNRIERVQFIIDEYVFYDDVFSCDDLNHYSPHLGWPELLTDIESSVRWRGCNLMHIFFEHGARRLARGSR